MLATLAMFEIETRLFLVILQAVPGAYNFFKSIFFMMFQKLWFQHTWPLLEQEIRSQEVLAAVLEPVLFLVGECSPQEYTNIILPVLR